MSLIEQYQSRIKSILKKNYNIIPKDIIIYYFKEDKCRSYFNKDKVTDKETIINKLFKDVYEICNIIILLNLKLEILIIMIDVFFI